MYLPSPPTRASLRSVPTLISYEFTHSGPPLKPISRNRIRYLVFGLQRTLVDKTVNRSLPPFDIRKVQTRRRLVGDIQGSTVLL